VQPALENLQPRELLNALAVQIYEPPLLAARERFAELGEALRIVILIIDFDSELAMNGMLGFLENPAGLWLHDTIKAMETIGAIDTATVLRRIERIMLAHGVTPTDLRADFQGHKAFEITTFAQVHGEHRKSMADEILREAQHLYAASGWTNDLIGKLEAYVTNHREHLIGDIRRFTTSTPNA
jgi:hypothetical protein